MFVSVQGTEDRAGGQLPQGLPRHRRCRRGWGCPCGALREPWGLGHSRGDPAHLAGDILGKTILGSLTPTETQQLLRLPRSCPEQMLSSLAPMIILTCYLDATGQWDKVGVEHRTQVMKNIVSGERGTLAGPQGRCPGLSGWRAGVTPGTLPDNNTQTLTCLPDDVIPSPTGDPQQGPQVLPSPCPVSRLESDNGPPGSPQSPRLCYIQTVCRVRLTPGYTPREAPSRKPPGGGLLVPPEYSHLPSPPPTPQGTRDAPRS